MPDVLYHFSEDSAIRRFVPHVAKTAAIGEPRVWAIDQEHADLYYFPRDCPRVTFHVRPETSAEDRRRFLGETTAQRVAAIEAAWLERLRATALYRYLRRWHNAAPRPAVAGAGP